MASVARLGSLTQSPLNRWRWGRWRRQRYPPSHHPRIAFLIFVSIPGEDMTRQEDWLYAAFCCLLPIGGVGAILGGIGGFIWYTRLRER